MYRYTHSRRSINILLVCSLCVLFVVLNVFDVHVRLSHLNTYLLTYLNRAGSYSEFCWLLHDLLQGSAARYDSAVRHSCTAEVPQQKVPCVIGLRDNISTDCVHSKT